MGGTTAITMLDTMEVIDISKANSLVFLQQSSIETIVGKSIKPQPIPSRNTKKKITARENDNAIKNGQLANFMM